jgi:hypothetical protein
MTDQAVLCTDCTDDAIDLLRQVTAVVIRSDREPRTEVLQVRRLDGSVTTHRVIVRGDYARRPSTRWDTPSGEVANLPRMLAEQTAKLAVRTTQARLRTMPVDPPLPLNVHAAGRADDLGAVVLGAVTQLTGRTPPQGATVLAAAADLLIEAMPRVRLLDWSPEWLHDLRRAVVRAARAVDRPPARIYLGPCDRRLTDPATGADLGPCPGEYLAHEGDACAPCSWCRVGVNVAVRKKALLDEAADRWMTAAQTEHLTAALGHRVAKTTVDSWGTRGQVRRARLDGEDGPWSYPLADVLARVEAARAKERRSA